MARFKNLACVKTLCAKLEINPVVTLYPPSKTETNLPSQYLSARICNFSVTNA